MKEAGLSVDELGEKGNGANSKLKSAFSSIGSAAAKCGKAVATGLAVGITALAGLVAKSVQAAGELEQNMGGSEAVFGEFAGTVQGYAKEAYAACGLATSEYLATANKMGALLQGNGFTIEESMNLSSAAMQRAADVASIMGIDVSSAMEAVAGAAKGNFTMMDNLGVAMNATTIEAYAMSKGINKAYKEMTNQEKTALALEMFLEKTAYAAGNYAKENDTLAGSLNTAKAAFQNFLDGSGGVEQLVDAWVNAGQVIARTTAEMAPTITEGIVELINGIMPMIPELLGQLLPTLLEGVVNLINGIVAMAPDLAAMLLNLLPSLLDAVSQIMMALLEGITTTFPVVVETIAQMLPEIINSITTFLPKLIAAGVLMVGSLLAGIAANLPDILNAVVDMLDEVINAVIDNIPVLLEAAIEFFMAVVNAIPEFLPELIAKLPEIVDKVMNCLVENIPVVLDGAIELFMAIVNAIPEFLPELVAALPTIIAEIITAIIDAVPDLLAAAIELFAMIPAALLDTIPNLIAACGEFIASIITNLVDKAKEVMNFDWSLPKLKLPRINVEGSFSLNPLSWPKFSLTWFARGGVFDEPTPFPFNNGIGGLGEDGAEAVVPLENNTEWLDRIATMLIEKQGGNQPIYLTVDGKVFAQLACDSINSLTRQRGSIPLNMY